MDNIESNKGTGVRGCSGFTLKIIAVVTMLIDHVAATVLYRALLSVGNSFVTIETYEMWLSVYQVMRNVGRMAFPIYCFLLVEGFTHTRNVKKYAMRLFVFALISEVPFDLAFQKSVFDMSYNNVFFTLFIGLVVIACMRFLQDKIKKRWMFWSNVAALLIAFGGMLVAEFVLHTDYGASGVAAIILLYMFREFPKTAFASSVVALALLSSMTELYALLMLIPLAFYNGTRGKQIKYFFYVFYPLHLSVLVCICYLLGI